MDSADNLILTFFHDKYWNTIKVPPLTSSSSSVNTLFFAKANINPTNNNWNAYSMSTSIIFDSLSSNPTGYLIQGSLKWSNTNNKGNYLIHLDTSGNANWAVEPPDQNF
jgi:hypothetical protein